MLRDAVAGPRRVLMTLDAVGGVWRYAVDMARSLERQGVTCLLAGLGPAPSAAQQAECAGLATARLIWTEAPLDWLAGDAAALDGVGEMLSRLADDWDADLMHLNLPSQAVGVRHDRPVIVVSHSCVPTWWAAVRGGDLPREWNWQRQHNRRGLERADAVLAPSASHAAALRRAYGPLPRLRVVPNAVSVPDAGRDVAKQAFVLAAGRWWDEGKNATVLDAAAAAISAPVVMAGPLAGSNGEAACLRHARGTGGLPHGEVLALMGRAAVFAAPSRYEPFGLAVAEAALRGASLALADIATFRELWDGAALFVPPDDPDAWAAACNTLLQDRPLREGLAAQGRARAAAFTPERQAARLGAAYREAMAMRTAEAG